MKTTLSCPLGHKCEEAKNGEIVRCAWLIKVRGNNPNTGVEADEEGCAIAWMPVLLIETAGAARGTSSAVESFRNEMVKANEQTAMLNLVSQNQGLSLLK